MYTEFNFKSKKELKEAVKNGQDVRLFSLGVGQPKVDGIEYVEGPHYPQPHRWYARVEMKGGKVIRVLS